MSKRFSVIASAPVIAFLTASCSGSSVSAGAESVPDLAFTEETDVTQTTAYVARDFGFDDETQILVEFEADWACEVQNRTFDSTNDISGALEQRLGELEISDDEYGAFRARLTTDELVREAILDHYMASCKG